MRPLLVIAALALVLIVPRPALAAWANAGNPVVTNAVFTFDFPTPGGGFSSMCSDDNGGLYVAFRQNAGATPDSVKIQRLNRDGAVVWVGSRGLPVGPGEGLGNTPTLLADGSGGVWVAYFNSFSGSGFTTGLYAQHFDENGVTSIPFPGIRVGGVSTGMSGQPRAAVTTGGELLAMWIGQGAVGATDSVKVQRVSQNGALDFPAAGVLIGTSTQLGNDILAHSIVADGNGLVAVWTEETNSTGPERLRASRVSSAGVILWGTQGNTVFEDSDFAVIFADAIWDGTNGLTVAFSASDAPNGGNDLFVMRVDPAGTLNSSWGSASNPEVIVSTGMDPSAQRSLRIIDDGANGCIVGWVDVRNTAVVGPGGVPFRRDIRAQRFNSSGTRQWAVGGLAVNASENDQHQMAMIPDASGGAYLAYETIPNNDLIIDATGDLEVTHVSSAGAVLWNTFHSGSTQPVSNDGEQGEVMLAEDGGGGVMFAWDHPAGISANHRDSGGALYVPAITVTDPNGGEFFGAMQPIPATWASNVGGNVRLEYTVNNGAPVTIATSTADDGSQTWYAPILNSSQVRFRVSSVDLPAVADLSNAFFSICPTVNAPVTAGGPVSVPRDVEAGDFNEDGILDLAVAYSGGVAIFTGGGAGGVGNATFSGAAVYATPSAANRVAIGDFDEDGILDLAVTHSSGLMTFRGDGAAGVGDGTFAVGIPRPVLSGCVGIVIGDFDNDGAFDLAVTDSANNRVGILTGNTSPTGDGTGVFATAVYYNTGTAPENIAAADMDLDGDLDLVTANFAGNSITRMRNTGSNGFGTADFAVSSQGTFSGPHSIVLHDFDDDGDPDAAVANVGGISVHINSLANGISILGNSTDYTSGLPMADLVVADPSRNGIEDIVGASLIGAIETFFGDGASLVGDGTFTIGGGVVTTGTTAVALAASDFNEDGRIDFVVANVASNNLTVFTGGCASAVSNPPVVTSPNGGEVFQPTTFRTITWTKSTTTTSVDVELSRDGGVNWERIATDAPGTSLLWKVALPASGTARVRVLAHGHPHLADQSNANFAICDPIANDAPVATTAAGGPKDAVVADFNEDGIFDVVHDVGSSIAFKRGLGTAGVGSGLFASDVSYGAGGDTRNLVAADFNEDGILDVATTRAGGVAVLAGVGGGGVGSGLFGAAALVPAGSDPTGIAVGDFNEDGIQDLVVSSLGSDSIFVLLGGGANGVGDGTFPVRNRFAAGDAPGRITTGDFNEDGILDLAIASPSATSPGVQIMLGSGASGTGNGAFAATVRIAATGGASDAVHDVATGDFNEDGITDLAIASEFRVIMSRGNGALGIGNGTFAVPSQLDNMLGPRRVAVADFNRDGRADVMASYDGIAPQGTVRLFYGMGAGTVGNGNFTEPEDHSFGVGLGPIVLSDFEEDGELDALVGAPASSQYLRLMSSCSNLTASINVTQPAGGQEWLAGTQQVISWSASSTVMSVDVEISRDGGSNYETLARGVTANSFVWNVTGPFTQNARVRVRDSALPNTNAASANFLVYTSVTDAPPAPPAVVLAFSTPRPNPARGSSAFVLSLPQSERVTVDVYDMQGRHVRSLVRGELGGGHHTIAWDGRDDSGIRTSAGVYYARMRAGAFESTRHVVRVE